MSKTKFTKGPWEILPVEADKEYLRIRGTVPGGRYKIANAIDLEIYRGESEWCKLEREESVANANLIACAPDMYDALETIKRHILNMSICDHHLYSWVDENIDPLLKRARGE